MSAPFTIRVANQQDIPAMVELLRQLFTIEVDFDIDASRQARGLELLLADGPRACVLVAETEGRVIGMCTGQIVLSTAEGARSVWVEDMIIDAQNRGHGLGKALLMRLENWARERGATRLQLLADRHNDTALEFYRRNDWMDTQLLCQRRKI